MRARNNNISTYLAEYDVRAYTYGVCTIIWYKCDVVVRIYCFENNAAVTVIITAHVQY